MPENAELKPKERHFCEEYILDYNGKESAIRAGYPEKSAAKKACLLLKQSAVMSYIKELQDERSKRLCMSADYVLTETLDTLRKCKEPVPVMEWDYSEHKMVRTGEFTFDSKGACKCLEMLGKFLGVGDRPTGADGVVYIHDDLGG